MDEVQNENNLMDRSHDLQSKSLLEDLERQYVSLLEDRNQKDAELRCAHQQLKVATEKLASQQELEMKLASVSSQLEIEKTKVASMGEDNKVKQGQFDKLMTQDDNLREEIR